MNNTVNTEPNEKAFRRAFIKCTHVSKTTTITYLGLENRVRVTVSISVKFRFRVSILGLFVKAPSSDYNQAPIYPWQFLGAYEQIADLLLALSINPIQPL